MQGCAFHLVRAWNRMARELGLMRFIKGSKQVRAVVRWWRIVKGIVFLPKELITRVPALMFPPVNPRCSTYRPRLKCLKYLQDTWFNGTFQNIWCKRGIEESRTSNAAEAFHKLIV